MRANCMQGAQPDSRLLCGRMEFRWFGLARYESNQTTYNTTFLRYELSRLEFFVYSRSGGGAAVVCHGFRPSSMAGQSSSGRRISESRVAAGFGSLVLHQVERCAVCLSAARIWLSLGAEPTAINYFGCCAGSDSQAQALLCKCSWGGTSDVSL